VSQRDFYIASQYDANKNKTLDGRELADLKQNTVILPLVYFFAFYPVPMLFDAVAVL
jgi:hypothetical protein